MEYPQKSMLSLNTELHEQFKSVIDSFKDENLSYKLEHYDRPIGLIVSHALLAFQNYFLKNLLLGDGKALEYEERAFTTVSEAVKAIEQNLVETNELIKNFPQENWTEEITTEWGATMTKEMVIWTGMMQLPLHLGEITLMAGQGGFYQGTLG